MNNDLGTLTSLRRALEGVAKGKGMARSLLEELRPSGRAGREAARLILLGHPLRVSLRPVAESGSEEVDVLTTLILSTGKSGAVAVGKNGEALAVTLERWVKARESRRLEQKVQRFRSLVTSGVLGAVTAMVASLGPLVGSLTFSGQPPTAPAFLLPAAALMSGVSAGMLGAFMSGRRFYVNVVVSLLGFALVATLASPLSNVPPVGLWVVK